MTIYIYTDFSPLLKSYNEVSAKKFRSYFVITFSKGGSGFGCYFVTTFSEALALTSL